MTRDPLKSEMDPIEIEQAIEPHGDAFPMDAFWGHSGLFAVLGVISFLFFGLYVLSEQGQKLEADKNKTMVEDYRKQLSQLEQEKQALQGQTQDLSKQLEAAKAVVPPPAPPVDTREQIAARLIEAFKQKGINAQIDPHTGEVVIVFPESYFDYDSSAVKAGMIRTLKEIFPTYAATLMGDPEIRKKIDTVEFVGFASPVFQNKVVDSKVPGTQALSYNMDLSYRRAKAIFDHTFNAKVMRFEHQQDLFLISKISAKSYIASQLVKKPGAAPKRAQHPCQIYNCGDLQKVAIRMQVHEH